MEVLQRDHEAIGQADTYGWQYKAAVVEIGFIVWTYGIFEEQS